MRVLFDLISVQGRINGGAEYTKRVFEELCTVPGLKLYGLYNSGEVFKLEKFEYFSEKCLSVLDINNSGSIAEIVENNQIDCVFIGIMQRYLGMDLEAIGCRVVVTIHDLGDQEIEDNSLYKLAHFEFDKKASLHRWRIKMLMSIWGINIISKKNLSAFDAHKGFLLKDTTSIITDSDYSKWSIKYNIQYLGDKEINVLFPPLKTPAQVSENKRIASLVKKGHPYFLVLSAERWTKNVNIVFEVFKRVLEDHPEYRLVTTGIKESLFPEHIALPYTSAGELEYVIKNAAALVYASMMEGFGYPPLEAMKYGTPVICSNVTSLSEVACGGSIAFSPMYKTDLYRAFNEFLSSDRRMLRDKAYKWYEQVRARQESDLQGILKLILEK